MAPHTSRTPSKEPPAARREEHGSARNDPPSGSRAWSRVADAAQHERGHAPEQGGRSGDEAREPGRRQVQQRPARPLWELLSYEEYEEIPFTD